MRWHRSGKAAIILAGLASCLTGCMPTRTSMRPETHISDDYTPGVSKTGEGLAQPETNTGHDSTLGKSRANTSGWPASPSEGALPKTDLGKSEGSAADTENKESAGMAPPVPGLFPLNGNRPKMMPLGDSQIRRVSHETTVPKELPSNLDESEDSSKKEGVPFRKDIPQPTISKSNEDPKKIADAAKAPAPVTPIQLPPRGMPLEAGSGDINIRKSPTVSGAMLNLGVNDSGVERAVELSKLLEATEAENRNLVSRMKMLELVLENREKMLRDDESELSKASQDLAQARAELQVMREELTKVKKKLRLVEKDDLDNLRLMIQLLEKLLGASPPGP